MHMGDCDFRHQAIGHHRCPHDRPDKHVLVDGHTTRKRRIGHEYVLLDSLPIKTFDEFHEMLAIAVHGSVEVDVSDIHGVIPLMSHFIRRS